MWLDVKFHNGTLTEEDVKTWLLDQDLDPFLTNKNINHITKCLYHIYLWYREDYPIGDFLTAVLKNDFIETCGRADNINQKVLPIYAKFLYNCVPIDYKIKAKESLK